MNNAEDAQKVLSLYGRLAELRRSKECVEKSTRANITIYDPDTFGNAKFPANFRYAKKAGLEYFNTEISAVEKELKSLGFDPKDTPK